MTARDAEDVLPLPDGGRRLRTPEFYRGRAAALREYANQQRALARGFHFTATACDKQANKALDQADLIESWAEQAEREQHNDGSGSQP